MMHKNIYLLLAVTLCSCSGKKDAADSSAGTDLSVASQIVTRSVERHGGLAAWERLQSISYTKETILFDSTGAKESDVVQRHNFKMKPSIEGSIRWEDNGDSVRIAYANGEAIKYVNNKPDTTANEASKNAVLASLYVLFQPFRLLADETELKYISEDIIDDLKVNKIMPIYEGSGPEDDQWEFCFEKETDELVANILTHRGRHNYIVNLSFDATSPLKLHHHRKSYFVDRLLSNRVLRAEYFYTKYSLDINPIE